MGSIISYFSNDPSYNIWRGIRQYDFEKFCVVVDEYDERDTNYPHPILHECASQGEWDKLAYLWNHAKFKDLLHNEAYVDKYGNTALERLALEMYANEISEETRSRILQEIDDRLMWDYVKCDFDSSNYRCRMEIVNV